MVWTKDDGRDNTPIIVDKEIVVQDERVELVDTDEGGINWDFRITKVEPNDEGVYVCRISTDPQMTQQQTLSIRGTILSLDLTTL